MDTGNSLDAVATSAEGDTTMIDEDKIYITRLGMPVRIYATDAGGLFPVHGAIFNDGMWNGWKWTEEGKTHFATTSCMVNTDDDLREVKPRHQRTLWMNMYLDYPDMRGHKNEAAADQAARDDRIACIKIDLDFEEGEGL
jgi:hypothetical protein